MHVELLAASALPVCPLLAAYAMRVTVSERLAALALPVARAWPRERRPAAVRNNCPR